MKKTTKVIMLPTEKAVPPNGLGYRKSDNRISMLTGFSKNDAQNYESQHLYLISDEEIKDKDWIYSVLYGVGQIVRDYGGEDSERNRPLMAKFLNSETFQSYHRNGIWQKGEHEDVSAHNARKIIASTDPSLGGQSQYTKEELDGANPIKYGGIPLIPESFVKAYVEQQGKIDEVQIELEEIRRPLVAQGSTLDKIIKLREDNTVTIHRAKTYTREEVLSLILKSHEEMNNLIDMCQQNGMYDKWIEENL